MASRREEAVNFVERRVDQIHDLSSESSAERVSSSGRQADQTKEQSRVDNGEERKKNATASVESQW